MVRKGGTHSDKERRKKGVKERRRKWKLVSGRMVFKGEG